MAVYTKLVEAEFEQVLERYSLGSLARYEAIDGGIENTNYFIYLQQSNGSIDKYVLTIFENIDVAELPFFTSLTSFLADAGFPVPNPQKQTNDALEFLIKDKHGVIVPCLEGSPHIWPSKRDCLVLGKLLGQMHVSLADYKGHRVQGRDLAWMQSQAEEMNPYLPSDLVAELKQRIEHYLRYRADLMQCPHGIVHGDLFRDNVLFSSGQASGVIDFYHACEDVLLFDLAVAANDWCWQGKSYDQKRLSAIVSAYQEVRPWSELEERIWPYCLELAALRFWISRLHSRYVPGYQQDSLSGDQTKDPEEMRNILLHLDSLSANKKG